MELKEFKMPDEFAAREKYYGRTESHKQNLIKLGIDPNCPMPTNEELKKSFIALQPWIEEATEFEKKFLILTKQLRDEGYDW